MAAIGFTRIDSQQSGLPDKSVVATQSFFWNNQCGQVATHQN